MPYPNTHSCRIANPIKGAPTGQMTRKHNGKPYQVIRQQKKGGEWIDQAYRYKKTIWTAASARSHCKVHNGILFEPAKKSMEDTMQYKACYSHITKDISKEEPGSPIPFRLTERMVDRDGDVIEPKGGQLKEFRKNPRVLWSHNIEGGFSRSNRPSIGSVLVDTIEQTDNYLDADVVFDVENDPFAKMIDAKYRSGFLNAGSIGFMALTIGREPVLPKQKGATILKWNLFEFSMVNIPANIGAARKDWDSYIDEYNAFDCITEKIDKGEFFENYKEYFEEDTENKEEHFDFTSYIPPVEENMEIEITKAGAVLSTANRKVINDALTSITTLRTDLGKVESSLKALLESTQKPPKEPEKEASYIQTIKEIQENIRKMGGGISISCSIDLLKETTKLLDELKQ